MYISNEAAGLKGPLDLLGQFMAVSYASNEAATFKKWKIQKGETKSSSVGITWPSVLYEAQAKTEKYYAHIP